MAKNVMRITLKPHEKLFLNGAVLQVDRKTSIELLNDATFLLGTHVLQADETDTPLKQLYYAAQMALIDPANRQKALILFSAMLERLTRTISDKTILEALRECRSLYAEERIFDMLKVIRALFPQEEKIFKNTVVGTVMTTQMSKLTTKIDSETCL